MEIYARMFLVRQNFYHPHPSVSLRVYLVRLPASRLILVVSLFFFYVARKLLFHLPDSLGDPIGTTFGLDG